MERELEADQAAQGAPRCPRCGSVLELRPLEVKDEDDGEGELLLLLDCPRDDFHTALTQQDVVAFVTAEVMAKLAPNRPFLAP